MENEKAILDKLAELVDWKIQIEMNHIDRLEDMITEADGDITAYEINGEIIDTTMNIEEYNECLDYLNKRLAEII